MSQLLSTHGWPLTNATKHQVSTHGWELVTTVTAALPVLSIDETLHIAPRNTTQRIADIDETQGIRARDIS